MVISVHKYHGPQPFTRSALYQLHRWNTHGNANLILAFVSSVEAPEGAISAWNGRVERRHQTLWMVSHPSTSILLLAWFFSPARSRWWPLPSISVVNGGGTMASIFL